MTSVLSKVKCYRRETQIYEHYSGGYIMKPATKEKITVSGSIFFAKEWYNDMTRKKFFIKRLFPPIMIIMVTVLMSVYAYHDVLKMEEKMCWEILENTAQTINNEIKTRFQDNVSILKLTANAMVQENRVESYDSITKHINAFQPMTIFSRIDMLYPDDTMLLQNGERIKTESEDSFAEIAAEGEHMSKRTIDIVTGNETIYYYVPVTSNGETLALLVGAIECKQMPEIFKTVAYGGEAFICLVDYSDGSFILDDWHDKLGNMFEMKQRKQLKGYRDVDLIDDVRNGRTGVNAYASAENGENSYMYYTPVGVHNWELLIVVQEQVAFNSLLKLKGTLFTLGTVEAILLSLYFVWTILTVSQLEKSKQEVEEKKRAFEQLSYIDTLTKVYNRNKYNEMLESHQNDSIRYFGIVFFDLNGLKQVNDEYGHKAGDMLIQNAVSNINTVFPNLTYRIGGDEFVVLAPDIAEQKFTEKVQEVRIALEENKISISIGVIWREQCDDLDEQIKEADDQMYVQKQLFYERLSKAPMK